VTYSGEPDSIIRSAGVGVSLPINSVALGQMLIRVHQISPIAMIPIVIHTH